MMYYYIYNYMYNYNYVRTVQKKFVHVFSMLMFQVHVFSLVGLFYVGKCVTRGVCGTPDTSNVPVYPLKPHGGLLGSSGAVPGIASRITSLDDFSSGTPLQAWSLIYSKSTAIQW